MLPTEQEQSCADAICRYLAEATNRVWSVQRWLDLDENENRSPDALLSDGAENLMVEITRLTDGRKWNAYDNDLASLRRRLAPDRTRNYCLFLPRPYHVKLGPKEVRSLKHSIARVASGLQIGYETSIAVSRQGKVRFLWEANPGYVKCNHVDDSALRSDTFFMRGAYFLEDQDDYCHQFLSDKRRLEFHRRLSEGCYKSRHGHPVTVNWEEEWKLRRLVDSTNNEGGVSVLGFVVDRLESAAIRSVQQALRHGKDKFHGGKITARAAVALHAGESQHMLTLKQYEDAIISLSTRDVDPLDSVFLVSGQHVHRCFAYRGEWAKRCSPHTLTVS